VKSQFSSHFVYEGEACSNLATKAVLRNAVVIEARSDVPRQCRNPSARSIEPIGDSMKKMILNYSAHDHVWLWKDLDRL
jgi:hypothetical protein